MTHKKKPACGTPAPKQKKQQPSAQAEPDTGLKAMSSSDANEYVKSLAAGEVELAGIEANIANQLKELTQQHGQNTQKVQQLTTELERAKAAVLQINGSLSSLTGLLVQAEDERRMNDGRDI